MANLIPPVDHGRRLRRDRQRLDRRLFLAGVVPGVLIGIGLMIYSYFWGRSA
jgi:hypothetical protein